MLNIFISRKSRLSFLVFATIFLLIYYDLLLYDGVLNSSERYSVTNASKKVVILFWTAYFAGPFTSYYNHFINPNDSCFHKNCLLVLNRSYLLDSDAVLFHGHDHDLKVQDLPKFHLENQLWVYLWQESPVLMRRLENYSNVFNWTMTYRRDSDVYHSYFRVLKQPPDSNFKFMNKDQLKQKTKLVAWVVSNCNVQSRRGSYVKELQRLIPVDIYGRCGHFNCSKGARCFSELGKQYKFYLSFENAYCTDYTTEKFKNALNNNLVPIVMGGGDYEDFAPTGSYINVDDFSSVKALAKHLVYLDKNPDEYMKYFEWQSSYKIADGDGFCDLCEKVRAHKMNPRKKVYVDLRKWWHYVEPNYGNKVKTGSTQTGKGSDEILYELAADHTVPACHEPTWKLMSNASESSSTS